MDVKKIDVIVDKIMNLSDEEGYFSSTELRSAFDDQKDLQKVASLTINQLENHSFSKDGKLRAPTRLGKESVKKFINFAKTARLQGRKLSFAEAEEIVERQKRATEVHASSQESSPPAILEKRNSKGVILRKAARPVAIPKVDPEPPATEKSEDGQKIDRLAQVIFEISSPDGYFDPKEAYARIKRNGLSKRLSVIVSNIRLQGFVSEGKLRIPASGRPEAIKEFINLTARLRRQKTFMTFEDAMEGLGMGPTTTIKPPAEVPLSTVVPAPPVEAPRPAEFRPEVESKAPECPIPTSPQEDFKAMYYETKGKVSRLQGELTAYKEIWLRFVDMIK
jgi:hypothetical protein